LFSQSLLYPDEERLANMSNAARELDRQDQAWAAFPFFPQWSRFLRCLKDLANQDPVAIQNEYVSNFQVNRAGIPCPIYESAYLEEDPSLIPSLLADLEGEYAQVGLFPSPVLREPPDHAAVELEFMAFLCSREAEAWQEQGHPELLQMLQRQRDFLKHHLSRWFAEFARTVAATNRDSVFAAATAATWSFLAHDHDLLGSLIQRVVGVEERS
ncbi:MAG: molecular chaperone, partial [Dehalococcoidia bacterium]